jgi:hypothetical protein
MVRCVRGLLVAAFLSLSLVGCEAEANNRTKTADAAANGVVDADPALWVIRDADTTIYLFGTVHLLPPGLGWFDEAVEEAFRASDELTLEILPSDDEGSLAPMMVGYARDARGRTIRDRLTPVQYAAYVERLKGVGLPAEAMEPFEPWFVITVAAVMDYARRGYTADAGSETVLTAAAKSAGKRITAFETPEEQIRILDSTPENEQIDGLLAWVAEAEQVNAMWDELVQAWARGDPERAGALMNREMAKSPVTAKLLLEDRNRRWVAALQQRMSKPGTVFVAVGAGHLMGDMSVQALLKEKGLEAERIRY